MRTVRRAGYRSSVCSTPEVTLDDEEPRRPCTLIGLRPISPEPAVPARGDDPPDPPMPTPPQPAVPARGSDPLDPPMPTPSQPAVPARGVDPPDSPMPTSPQPTMPTRRGDPPDPPMPISSPPAMPSRGSDPPVLPITLDSLTEAIDELAADSCDGTVPPRLAERIARLWAMVSDLDPELARRRAAYEQTETPRG